MWGELSAKEKGLLQDLGRGRTPACAPGLLTDLSPAPLPADGALPPLTCRGGGGTSRAVRPGGGGAAV